MALKETEQILILKRSQILIINQTIGSNQNQDKIHDTNAEYKPNKRKDEGNDKYMRNIGINPPPQEVLSYR